MKLAVKSLLGLGTALGASAITAIPAMALTSLTNPMLGGTNPTSFTLWCSNAEDPAIPAGNSVPCSPQDPNQWLEPVLQKGGGNVELGNPSTFDFTKFTSLTGDLGGKPFFARSLTEDDWSANDNALTKQFLSDALAATGIVLPPGATFDDLVNLFIVSGGPERFSNPNIDYVHKDENEKLTVGLAGILNVSPLLAPLFPGVPIPPVVQVSELVYVEFHGQSSYLYSFTAENSGLSTIGPINPPCDGTPATGVNDPRAICSHTGTYTPMLEKVPEPSSLLGLLAVGGGLLAAKRGKKS